MEPRIDAINSQSAGRTVSPEPLFRPESGITEDSDLYNIAYEIGWHRRTVLQGAVEMIDMLELELAFAFYPDRFQAITAELLSNTPDPDIISSEARGRVSQEEACRLVDIALRKTRCTRERLAYLLQTNIEVQAYYAAHPDQQPNTYGYNGRSWPV